MGRDGGRDRPTCGKGLAGHAALPEKLGELMASVARILELHTTTLVREDEAARAELAAYAELAEAHWRIAAELSATASRMADCVDLPMAEHDEAALSDPRHAEAFAELVRLEGELAKLLEERLEADRTTLARMDEA